MAVTAGGGMSAASGTITRSRWMVRRAYVSEDYADDVVYADAPPIAAVGGYPPPPGAPPAAAGSGRERGWWRHRRWRAGRTSDRTRKRRRGRCRHRRARPVALGRRHGSGSTGLLSSPKAIATTAIRRGATCRPTRAGAIEQLKS